MIEDVNKFIIFLHGFAGAGKGETLRKITEWFEQKGYTVIYASGGALFRNIFSNPAISEKLRAGVYYDTLDAIMPGLQQIYEYFMKCWISSEGKAVFILDGVIRRGSFTNEEGQFIPSQIEQVAAGFQQVDLKLTNLNPILDNKQPFDHFQNHSDQDSTSNAGQIVIGSWHILLDVTPEDAEEQMKLRANKEVASIKTQLQMLVQEAKLSPEKASLISELVRKMESLLHGSLEVKDGLLCYVPQGEINGQIPRVLYQPIKQELQNIRKDLAKIVGMSESDSFSALFRALGISTEIRDEDISPLARETRISSQVIIENGPEGQTYAPGFVTQMLIDELGYIFRSDGSFKSKASNCIVITNGNSRGVKIDELRSKCISVAQKIYTEAESMRARFFGNS